MGVLAAVGLAAAVGLVASRRPGDRPAPPPVRARAAPGTMAQLAGPALRGRVIDQTGRGIPGVIVVAWGEGDRRARASAVSDSAGAFVLELSLGVYGLTAAGPGASARTTGVAVPAAGEVVLRLLPGLALTGHVLEVTGGPIAGAAVHASMAGEGSLYLATSDQAGRYSLALPGARYELIVEADGYVGVRDTVDLMAASARSFRLEPAALITGRVVQADGQTPVAGAEVTAQPSRWPWNAVLGPATSDDAGHFELRALPAGQYRVSARASDLVGVLERPLSIASGEAARDVVVTVSAGAVLGGRVTAPSKDPVVKARVVLAAVGGRPRLEPYATGETDAKGRYRLPGIIPGSYRLTVSAPGHGTALLDLLITRSIERDVVLDQRAMVVGTVLDVAGAPAPSAEVWGSARPEGTSAAVVSEKAITDARGRFELRLPPGAVSFEVTAGDEALQSGSERLARGEIKEVTLRLKSAARIRGTVVWEDGQPAGGAQVSGGRGSPLRASVTDQQGRFDVGPFPAGLVTVTAAPPGSTGSMPAQRLPTSDLQLKEGERRTGVVLTLPRRTRSIDGVVVGPAGPLEGVTVEAGLERGGSASRGGPDGARTVSGVDGAFHFSSLENGRYTLWADHPRLASVERTGVGPDQENVRLEMKAEGVLAGRVVGAAGTPVAACRLVVMPPARPRESELHRFVRAGAGAATSDRQGEFRVDGLAAGTYDVVATAPDGSAGRLDGVVLAQGERKEGLRVELEGSVTVVGKVVDAETGRPLAGIEVSSRGSGQLVQTRTDGSGAFAIENIPRLPLVFVTFKSASETHQRQSIVVPQGAGSRVDVGAVKLVRADPGNPNRGHIGARFAERDGVVVVSQITPDSPAAGAGLQPGDVLVSVGSRKVTGLVEAAEVLRDKEPGKDVRLVVQTPGQSPREIAVRVPM
jgi:hypothetical protein